MYCVIRRFYTPGYFGRWWIKRSTHTYVRVHHFYVWKQDIIEFLIPLFLVKYKVRDVSGSCWWGAGKNRFHYLRIHPVPFQPTRGITSYTGSSIPPGTRIFVEGPWCSFDAVTLGSGLWGRLNWRSWLMGPHIGRLTRQLRYVNSWQSFRDSESFIDPCAVPPGRPQAYKAHHSLSIAQFDCSENKVYLLEPPIIQLHKSRGRVVGSKRVWLIDAGPAKISSYLFRIPVPDAGCLDGSITHPKPIKLFNKNILLYTYLCKQQSNTYLKVSRSKLITWILI